jgi:hypothetical protein
MKTVKKTSTGAVFQGDIMLTRVEKLPPEAKENEDSVVAHSETGHHHVAERAKVFSVPDGETLYLQALGKTVDIVHRSSRVVASENSRQRAGGA